MTESINDENINMCAELETLITDSNIKYQNILDTVNKIIANMQTLKQIELDIKEQIEDIQEKSGRTIKSNKELIQLRQINENKKEEIKELIKLNDEKKLNYEKLCTEIRHLNTGQVAEGVKKKKEFYEALTGIHFDLSCDDHKRLEGFIKNTKKHYVETFNINLSSASPEKIPEILFKKMSKAASTSWEHVMSDGVFEP